MTQSYNTNGGNPIGVVFLLDTSSSMRYNIRGVATHPVNGRIYNASDVDYGLGLIQFSTIPSGDSNKNKNKKKKIIEK